MLTICWAAKGGSGTTVYVAARALTTDHETLVVDLGGDVPRALGMPSPDGPGVLDWLASDAPADRLRRLEQRVTDGLSVVHAGRLDAAHAAGSGPRWFELAAHLRADGRRVLVDAGTGDPPAALLTAADESLLVTRSCYLAVQRAVDRGTTPTGIVLVEEPGRALGVGDVEVAIGAPVVAHALLDPMIARAVDSGLLVSRLPRGWKRALRNAA